MELSPQEMVNYYYSRASKKKQAEIKQRMAAIEVDCMLGHLGLCCVLTNRPFVNPVMAADNYTYEYSAISTLINNHLLAEATKMCLQRGVIFSSVTPDGQKQMLERLRKQYPFHVEPFLSPINKLPFITLSLGCNQKLNEIIINTRTHLQKNVDILWKTATQQNNKQTGVKTATKQRNFNSQKIDLNVFTTMELSDKSIVPRHSSLVEALINEANLYYLRNPLKQLSSRKCNTPNFYTV